MNYVDRFFYEIRKLHPGKGKEEILEIAKSIERPYNQSPHIWFESLGNNEKMYAMLAGIFYDVDRPILDQIYLACVQRLRDTGINNLQDPREIGINSILENINSRETEGYFVRFDNIFYESEIQRQIANHSHLLWSLIDIFLELSEQFKHPVCWALRKSLGTAIGQIGRYHRHKLPHVLDKLAGDPSHGVVAVAGYALDALCRAGSAYHAFVIQRLTDWVNSGNPDFMWAAGAAIWRLYDGLASAASAQNGQGSEALQAAETLQKVRDLLSALAENIDQFHPTAYAQTLSQAQQDQWTRDTVGSLISSIGYAVFQIAQSYPCDMVKQIAQWLRAKPQSNLWGLGVITGTRLLTEFAQYTSQLRVEQHQSLLDLIALLLRVDADLPEGAKSTASDLFGILLGWLQSQEEIKDQNDIELQSAPTTTLSPRREWMNAIHTALLKAVNCVTPTEAPGLRTGLIDIWLSSEQPDVQRIARGLLTRAHIMAGLPLDMPGLRYGVIALDASHRGRLAQDCATLGFQLCERLTPQVDLYVIRMGAEQALAKPGQFVSPASLHASHNRPRLLLPALETLALQHAHFILALAWGPIHDSVDIQNDDTRGRKLDRHVFVAPLGGPTPPSLATTTIPLVNVQAMETQLQEAFGEAMGLSHSSSPPTIVIPLTANPRLLEDHVLAIEQSIQEHLHQALAALTPEAWWAGLKADLDVDPSNLDGVVARLTSWIAHLDDIAYAAYPKDVARTIACTILWLSTVDLPRCVALVRAWLQAEDKLQRLMGTACGKMLFRLHAHRTPIPEVSTHGIMLDLAPLLARQGWEGAAAVLYAARRWGVCAAWTTRFLSQPDGTSGTLLQVVEAIIPTHVMRFKETLEDWVAPGDDPDAKATPESIVTLVERLNFYVALHTAAQIPALPDGHHYGLIVVDTAARSDRRHFWATVASRVLEALKTQCPDTLHLLLYRLGQTLPVPIPEDDIVADMVIPPDLSRQPRLLWPILETHSISQVSFVVVLTDSVMVDMDDWQATPWNERIALYRTMGWGESAVKEAVEAICKHVQ